MYSGPNIGYHRAMALSTRLGDGLYESGDYIFLIFPIVFLIDHLHLSTDVLDI
jgi:hypothetical protein